MQIQSGPNTFSVSFVPPPQVLLDIPAKLYSIQVGRNADGKIYLAVADMDGHYYGDQLATLLSDLETVIQVASIGLCNDEDGEELTEEATEESPEEQPPSPATGTQADGDMWTTFCECADCRRRRDLP